MIIFFLHHPSSSSSSRRALHATQDDWFSDRARTILIIVVVAHAPIDSDIKLLLGHDERCVSTTNNPLNASDGRDERRDRSVTGVWCARRGMPHASARTATFGAARPTVGVAKRHIARDAHIASHSWCEIALKCASRDARARDVRHTRTRPTQKRHARARDAWRSKRQNTYSTRRTYMCVYLCVVDSRSRAVVLSRAGGFMSIARVRARAYFACVQAYGCGF